MGGETDTPSDQNEPAKKGPPIEDEASTANLRKASAKLKAKIAEAKVRNDMPFDSTLGTPNWDQNAADGHLDVPDDGDDGWPRLPVRANKTSAPRTAYVSALRVHSAHRDGFDSRPRRSAVRPHAVSRPL